MAEFVASSAAEVASLIGANSEEIVFTSGATEANNMALLGIGRRAIGSKRNRILMPRTEHKCVLESGRIMERDLGFTINYLSVDGDGRIDMDKFESEIDEDILLVSVMAVNNEIGTIQDIKGISKLTSRYGCLLHCDAAQAPCAIDISNYADFADLISLSAHKMYGPMGIGALFIRQELQNDIEPLVYGGGQQSGLRSGTLPPALCVGFGAAAKLIANTVNTEYIALLLELRDYFFECLEPLNGRFWINGPKDMSIRHPANINLGFKGISAQDLLSRVQPQLAASTGSACTSGIQEPSHVLREIGLSREDSSASIRFSLGKFTTKQELADAAGLLRAAIDEI